MSGRSFWVGSASLFLFLIRLRFFLFLYLSYQQWTLGVVFLHLTGRLWSFNPSLKQPAPARIPRGIGTGSCAPLDYCGYVVFGSRLLDRIVSRLSASFFPRRADIMQKGSYCVDYNLFIIEFAKVKEILMEEPTVLPLSPPITVCGNIHGQLWDLLEIFKIAGELPNTKYLFLVRTHLCFADLRGLHQMAGRYSGLRLSECTLFHFAALL